LRFFPAAIWGLHANKQIDIGLGAVLVFKAIYEAKIIPTFADWRSPSFKASPRSRSQRTSAMGH
jgi:hypothetical protein